MGEFDNYRTVNKMEGAEEKQWCISVKLRKTGMQATVALNNGKSYEYASRFPVAEGDVAIIGKTYVYKCYLQSDTMATTGQMGTVSDTRSKIEIKKNHAAELDFVFTDKVSKKMLEDCVTYLDMPGDKTTLQYDFGVDTVYPITFLIRKLLTAASIISNSKFTDEASVEKAKKYIMAPQIIDAKMSELFNESTYDDYTYIDLWDVHIDTGDKIIKELKAMNIPAYEDGIINGEDRDGTISDELNAWVNKYAYIGAISIMVRGGFVNLLEAFLSVNPPISEFYDELLDLLGENGNRRAIDIIKNYNVLN